MLKKQRRTKTIMDIEFAKKIVSIAVNNKSIFIVHYTGQREINKRFILKEVNNFLIEHKGNDYDQFSLLIPIPKDENESGIPAYEKFSIDRYGKMWAVYKEQIEDTPIKETFYVYRDYVKNTKDDLFNDNNNHPELGHPSYKQIINDLKNIESSSISLTILKDLMEIKNDQNVDNLLKCLDKWIKLIDQHIILPKENI